MKGIAFSAAFSGCLEKVGAGSAKLMGAGSVPLSPLMFFLELNKAQLGS